MIMSIINIIIIIMFYIHKTFLIFSSLLGKVFENEPAWEESTEGSEDKKNYSQGKTKCHLNHSLLTEPENSALILAL
ncbi:hypothetical protein DUI87_12931 [Hirundo rustica rustica]|uniref:Uncharacterized protein n=1 Tax=Hirundo rustica rustica TaxID=333673 RepID=A0A3M0KAH6_HIRRU|nr:hypothetical protein DUI87_12931 [Hirundo rustica rustica]